MEEACQAFPAARRGTLASGRRAFRGELPLQPLSHSQTCSLEALFAVGVSRDYAWQIANVRKWRWRPRRQARCERRLERSRRPSDASGLDAKRPSGKAYSPSHHHSHLSIVLPHMRKRRRAPIPQTLVPLLAIIIPLRFQPLGNDFGPLGNP